MFKPPFLTICLLLSATSYCSLPLGKLGGQDSFESIDSFDSEDYPSALHSHKPKGTFKDYVRERSDLSKDKPVIPAAALAGYTGEGQPTADARPHYHTGSRIHSQAG